MDELVLSVHELNTYVSDKLFSDPVQIQGCHTRFYF